MALVPEGGYRPLFQTPGEPKELQVKAFYLDTTEVTVADFLEFVRANPQWARSQVKRVFADESYLKNWDDEFNPGTVGLDKPVTFVSWFAAKAYAQWRGKRLPTVAEWEHAAAASATQADGSAETGFKQAVLRWYIAPGSDLRSVRRGPPNLWGVYDLHGLVWEWVSDFNSVLLAGDSRAGDSLAGGFFCGNGSAGANDASDYPAFMRTGFRSSLKANYCVHNLGFRCAKDL
jgi:formylglycine-generating enzyme required for sulfatase activity